MSGGGGGVAGSAYAPSFADFSAAAQAGDAHAQYGLAHCYQYGLGVAADPARAAHWYEQAAAQGYAPAQHALGALYASGEGVTLDPSRAVQYYQQAAAQGYAPAVHALGDMYTQGAGVARDASEGRRLHAQARQLGYTPGVMYAPTGLTSGVGPSNHADLYNLFDVRGDQRSPVLDASKDSSPVINFSKYHDRNVSGVFPSSVFSSLSKDKNLIEAASKRLEDLFDVKRVRNARTRILEHASDAPSKTPENPNYFFGSPHASAESLALAPAPSPLLSLKLESDDVQSQLSPHWAEHLASSDEEGLVALMASDLRGQLSRRLGLLHAVASDLDLASAMAATTIRVAEPWSSQGGHGGGARVVGNPLLASDP